jgi:hypothetical protein
MYVHTVGLPWLALRRTETPHEIGRIDVEHLSELEDAAEGQVPLPPLGLAEVGPCRAGRPREKTTFSGTTRDRGVTGGVTSTNPPRRLPRPSAPRVSGATGKTPHFCKCNSRVFHNGSSESAATPRDDCPLSDPLTATPGRHGSVTGMSP